MFGKITALASVAAVVSASPINLSGLDLSGLSNINLSGVDLSNLSDSNLNGFSFSQFNNLGNFGVFDQFFGESNFLGLLNEINVANEVQLLQCLNTNVNVVQQQLAILSEVAKQIILTELCSVEDQVIALEQFTGRFDSFSRSVRGSNGITPSFDNSIAQLITQLIIDDQFNQNDFGFLGSDIGLNTFLVVGSDFSNVDFNSITLAYELAHEARIQALENVVVEASSGLVAEQLNTGLQEIGALNAVAQLSNIGSFNNGLNNININGLNSGLNNINNINGLNNVNNNNNNLNGVN